jgi:hypothetical protein
MKTSKTGLSLSFDRSSSLKTQDQGCLPLGHDIGLHFGGKLPTSDS